MTPASFPEENGLTIRPSTGLISLPEGGSPALSEIMNRSLAHIQTSKALAVPERRAGAEQEFEIAPGVKIVMCWIPPGEFLMGSSEDDPFRNDGETQHRVMITDGFWLGKYQVTQAQWEAVTGSNPSRFKGSNLPVESVSWNDISGPEGFLEMINRFAGAGCSFSLPTEAQWEYGCRAGTVTALNNGKHLTSAVGVCPNLEEVAWYAENSGAETHPVGQKKANDWGLHDMHGNVLEWCADWYGDYLDGPLVDCMGPDSGTWRVARGGVWFGYARYCHVAYRGHSSFPTLSWDRTGFRVARRQYCEISLGDEFLKC